MGFPARVQLIDVGPRDGLQNESRTISLALKLDYIRGLKQAGLAQIEAGAFVRPDRVPQMADSDQVFERVRTEKAFAGPTYWALVPNRRGLERALASGARAIGVFTAASESFNQRNIGMTIADSLVEIREVLREARRLKLRTRAYLSTVFGCPFEGPMPARQAIDGERGGSQTTPVGDRTVLLSRCRLVVRGGHTCPITGQRAGPCRPDWGSVQG